MFLVDFEFDEVAERRVRICALQLRRLICGNQQSVVKCNHTAWELLQFYNVPQRLKALEDVFDSTDSDR